MSSHVMWGVVTVRGGPFPIENPGQRHSAVVHTSDSSATARIAWVGPLGETLMYSSWATAQSHEKPLWFVTTLSSVAPVKAVSAVIEVVVSDGSMIDGVLLEATDHPGGYFDGSIPGADYVWGADPYRSVSRFYPQRMERHNRLLALLPDYLPMNQAFSLRYLEDFSSPAGIGVSAGTLGIDTLGLGNLSGEE